jgi:hypothetical protein
MALFTVTIVVGFTDHAGVTVPKVIWFPFEPSSPAIDTVERFKRELDQHGSVVGIQYDRTKPDDGPPGYVREPIVLGRATVVTVKLSSPGKKAQLERKLIGTYENVAYEDRVD